MRGKLFTEEGNDMNTNDNAKYKKKQEKESLTQQSKSTECPVKKRNF